MAVTCQPVDEVLLMLIHGQMSVGSRLATMAHLAVCPDCRRRRDELARATRLLAGAVRGPGTSGWRPHLAILHAREVAVAAATVAAVAAMAWSYFHWLAP